MDMIYIYVWMDGWRDTIHKREALLLLLLLLCFLHAAYVRLRKRNLEYLFSRGLDYFSAFCFFGICMYVCVRERRDDVKDERFSTWKTEKIHIIIV